ncbi:MAG: GTP-binding protein [Planctomycetaceae bacterium]|nr:GTP-binding protein [Planctomycetaceae bacterium]
MGEIQQPQPVLLLLAAFSRHEEALAWARQRSVEHWGEIAVESKPFSFEDTSYYEKTMGAGLSKIFFTFADLIDPDRLADIKRLTNEWEAEYDAASNHADERPLNLDPGYLTEAKLILATTKDRDHRIYLRDGIYAEGTLHFYKGAWQKRPWTYPDYQRQDYHDFFSKCRGELRARLRQRP